MAQIVLDTDVVSLHRRGHLPLRLARHVAANDLCITFVTAGELWKGTILGGWGEARRGAWSCGWTSPRSCRTTRRSPASGASLRPRRAAAGGDPTTTPGSRPAACRAGCRCWRDFADFADHHGLLLAG